MKNRFSTVTGGLLLDLALPVSTFLETIQVASWHWHCCGFSLDGLFLDILKSSVNVSCCKNLITDFSENYCWPALHELWLSPGKPFSVVSQKREHDRQTGLKFTNITLKPLSINVPTNYCEFAYACFFPPGMPAMNPFILWYFNSLLYSKNC